MTFSVRLQDLPPTLRQDQWRLVALGWLRAIGYLSPGYDPKTGVTKVTASVPFRIVELLLVRPDASWTVPQLCGRLRTTAPTIYRHLHKLDRMALLGRGDEEGRAVSYHLAHHELPLAWSVCEANARAALARNRTVCAHLQRLIGDRDEPAGPWQTVRTPVPFLLDVGTMPLDRSARRGRAVACDWLEQLGYLERKGQGGPPARSVGFRLVWDCFFRGLHRPWTQEDLAAALQTTRPTIGRHLHKLESMMLAERVQLDDSTQPPTRGFRIRYGHLSKAWDLVESHAEVAMGSYKETISHLSDLLDRG